MKHLPRVLSVLLVLVIITSIGVGFTYSKYIVDDSADDNARISKFGVTTGVRAGAFSNTYKSPDGTVTTVDRLDTGNTLAPGTSGTFSGINVQGTPEVDVKITTTADMELAGWTTTGSDYYCPVVVTINGTEYYGMNYASADAFEAAVEAAITTINNQTFDSGTNLANIPGLNNDYSWKWIFKGTDGKQTTAKDTALGDRAAAGNAGTFSLVVSAKVEQVD